MLANSKYKFLILFLVTSTISAVIIFFTSHQWSTAYSHNMTHVENINQIKSNLAEGHLWFEELLSGDPSLKKEHVLEFFEDAKKRAYKGHNGNELIAYESFDINNNYKVLEKDVQELIELANNRYENITIGSTGSRLDQEFDSIFTRAMIDCDQLTKKIKEESQSKKSNLLKIQNFILIIWILISLIISREIILMIKHEDFLKLELESANEDLEKKVIERTKELEDSKNRAEIANKAKSNFLATMSHEIRTPLNGILGFSSLLEDSITDQTQKDYIEIINNSGNGLLHIINDILDFSKIESGKIDIEYASFDIYEVVEQVIETLSSSAVKKGVEIVYDIENNVPAEITLDYTRLKQVLLNLLGNAIKFTNEGSITLLISRIDEDIHFSVSDTGVGINSDKMSNLFEAFTQEDSSTTRKFGGTGLGLAISKKLVNLMGGDISVSSSLGQGSTFKFFIKPSSFSMRKTGITEDLKNKTILIIDDNEVNLRLYQKQLERWGCTQIFLLDSPDVEQVQKILAENNIDLIISDYNMPKKNGYQLFCELDPSILPPLVLLTSSYYEEDKEHIEKIFNRVVFKPIGSARLKRVICEVLEILSSDKHQSEYSEKLDLAVLLVEDNLVNQKIATKFLNKFGIDPVVVDNGQEAVKEAINEFDVILMDIQMPVMDGIDATKVIRKLNLKKRPTIVALTANVFLEQKDEALSVGMDYFLSKPVKRSELWELLSSIKESPHKEKL